jgi:hypothetical protein
MAGWFTNFFETIKMMMMMMMTMMMMMMMVASGSKIFHGVFCL